MHEGFRALTTLVFSCLSGGFLVGSWVSTVSAPVAPSRDVGCSVVAALERLDRTVERECDCAPVTCRCELTSALPDFLTGALSAIVVAVITVVSWLSSCCSSFGRWLTSKRTPERPALTPKRRVRVSGGPLAHLAADTANW